MSQVLTGVVKAADIVRDTNLKVVAPLALSLETDDGMRELGTDGVFDVFYDGAIIETIDIEVIEDGGVIKLQLQADGGGDLTCRFGGTSYVLDCTPVLEETLTAGTDTVMQKNWIYITESAGVLTLTHSTVSYPVTSHCPIATVSLQTAASLATDGGMRVHAWTDHISKSTENGHLSHVNAKLRADNASYVSGVGPSDLVVSSPDAYISTGAGVVYQLHPHTMPARDMQAGDPVWVINDPTTPYKRITTFDDITQDASGGAINNKYMNIVLCACVSEKETDCKLFFLLPADTYTTEANAIADTQQTTIYAWPEEFIGTMVLVARYTVKAKTSGAWSQSQKESLLGKLPATGVGGGSITDHGSLGGLTDDDHTQYLLGDGTRDVTGDMLFTGTSKLQFDNTGHYLHAPDANTFLVNVDVTLKLSIGSTEQVILETDVLRPATDNLLDIGTTSKYIKDVYANRYYVGATGEYIYSSAGNYLDLNATLFAQIRLSGTAYHLFASTGYYPLTTDVNDIGSAGLRMDQVYCQQLNASHTTNPTSPVDGSLWYNETLKALQFNNDDAQWAVGGGVSFITSDSTATNTSAKFYFAGTKDIAANSLVVGACYEFVVSGKLTTDATISYTFGVDLDATQIVASTAKSQTSDSNAAWTFRGEFTVRSIGGSGTVQATAFLITPRFDAEEVDSPSAITVDTTQVLTFKPWVRMTAAGLGKSATAQNIILRRVA